MITLGAINHLRVTEALPFAFVLTDDKQTETVHLANLKAPKNTKVGQTLAVYVYPDEQGQLSAQLEPAKVQLNQCALLKAVGVTEFGAFFDWGLERDLLVRNKDQERPIAEGLEYLVYLFYDDQSDRLLGSTRLHYFYPEKISDEISLTVGQKAPMQVYAETELGYKVLIDGRFLGLLFKSDALAELRTGETFEGFVKQIRSDGKVDVQMHRDSHKTRRTLEQQILEDLQAHGGLSSITDKSSPDEIYAHFKVSKGAYKKAIGNLYKQRQIKITKTSIQLVE